MGLAGDGADLVLFAPEQEELEKTGREIENLGRRVAPILGDVTREDEIRWAVDQTRQLAGSVDAEGIRNAIAACASELGQNFEESIEVYLDMMPLYRMIKPDGIAAMNSFLRSAEANNITGETIEISGGYGL